MISRTTANAIRQPSRKAKIPNAPATRPDPLAIPMRENTKPANPKALPRSTADSPTGNIAISMQKRIENASPTDPVGMLLFWGEGFSLMVPCFLWPNNDSIETFDIVARCAASATKIVVAPIHDRMPVILPASAYDRWLDADEPVSDLQALLRPYPADKMAAYPISTYVNNPRNQGPKCIEPQ